MFLRIWLKKVGAWWIVKLILIILNLLLLLEIMNKVKVAEVIEFCQIHYIQVL